MFFISEKEILRRLDEKTAFRLARETFLCVARGQTVMPPKMYLKLPGAAYRDFRAMPAYVQTGRSGIAGIKWVCVFPENRKRGLPTVSALVVLNSVDNGLPLAVLDAGALTAIRTAAASALATHVLANPKPAKLALVGAGLQARYQLKALANLYSFKEVSVWGMQKSEGEAFLDHFKGKRIHSIIKPRETIRECVSNADIIVTGTPSEKPLLRAEWVKEGAHINAIGADAKGKQELDPAILKRARVIVDEWEQASHSGEINVPFSKGLFTKKDLCAELADIVSGKKRGRRSSRDITVFDSTGLAVLDIYFAHYACQRTG